MYTQKRWSGIDFWRGVGCVVMVIFHAGFDLNFLNVISIEVDRGFWLAMARFVQISFMLTTGITLFLSHRRGILNRESSSEIFKRRIQHAVKLFVLAMLITFVTYLLFGNQAVKFGVLHFYDVAMILALPLIRFGMWNAVFGVLVLGLSLILSPFDYFWFFPLSPTTFPFQSLDYFPLLPWFGVFLEGIALASFLTRFYDQKKTLARFYAQFPSIVRKPFEFLGRYSLWIYLFHQPILIGLIVLFVRFLDFS